MNSEIMKQIEDPVRPLSIGGKSVGTPEIRL
jgi:hypothetical protein